MGLEKPYVPGLIFELKRPPQLSVREIYEDGDKFPKGDYLEVRNSDGVGIAGTIVGEDGSTGNVIVQELGEETPTAVNVSGGWFEIKVSKGDSS